jgi:hypothetical protein
MTTRWIGYVLFTGVSVVIGCNAVGDIEPARVRSSDSVLEDGSEPQEPSSTAKSSGADASALAPPVMTPDASKPGPCDAYPDSKYCNGACRFTNDVNYGCGKTVCDSPCQPQNAVGACKNYECVIKQCIDGDYGDCDHDPSNGCETDLDEPQNCGSCGHKCPSASPYCNHGSCSATPRAD